MMRDTHWHSEINTTIKYIYSLQLTFFAQEKSSHSSIVNTFKYLPCIAISHFEKTEYITEKIKYPILR